MTTPRFASLPFGLRFALRDLLGDPRGFGVFIACVAIGVAAISGVSGLSRSLAQGLAREGRTILGGDASFSVVARDLSAEQRDYLAARGRLSEIDLMRAMARREDGEAAMIEIKTVDPLSYPVFGQIESDPAVSLATALETREGLAGALVDPALLARLDIRPGDVIAIGDVRFQLRAILHNEPDKLAGGVGFGPRVMIARAALARTGLMTPGAVVRHVARVTLATEASDAAVRDFVTEADHAFPQAGWETRSRDAVSPAFSHNLDRFAQLLTLVALTALVAGGAGVANAVQGFVDRKRGQFAVLKALGGSGRRVFAIALVQILAAAVVAIAIGLALGALIPGAAADALREIAQLPVAATPDAAGAALGALYGLLVTLMFSLGPLGRVHEIPVAALLRDDSRPDRLWRYRLAAAGAGLALLALAMVSAADVKIGTAYIGAAVAAVAVLRGAAYLVMRLARVLPHPRDPRLRLALANIWRPKSLTPALIVSIGVVQTLIIALTLIEGAIHRELERADTGEIPNFFFMDVPKDATEAFRTFLTEIAPAGQIVHVPMMRGRIVAVKGVPVDQITVGDDAKWALDGDRGVTFSATVPANSQLDAGAWWPEDYTGSPRVSLERKVAEGIGVKPGDEITVNVMGREIVATVANLRRLDWRSYGINFIMVFSPNVFRAAPYTELFTIAYGAPLGRDALDQRLAREAAKRFPQVVSIRVREAIAAIDKIAGQLALAARAAAAIAIVTAILALASALASSQRTRMHDAMILKTLGATRGWLVTAYGLEFALVGVVASIIAVAAGAGAAFLVTIFLMKIDFVFLTSTVAAISLITLGVTIALGLAGVWRVLARRPGPELREL